MPTAQIIALTHSAKLDVYNNKKSLYILRAINHIIRLKIIILIDEKQKVTVTEIYQTLQLQQAVASQHLAVLRKAKFVNTKKESKFVYYTLNYDFINKFSKTIEALVND